MTGADVLRALLVAALAVFDSSLALAYAVAFGLSCGTIAFNPAASSLLPDVVDEDDLVDANAALWTVAVLAQIVLAPTAGAVIAAVGVSAAFGVNAASYIVSAALLVGLRAGGRTRQEHHTSGWAAVSAGVTAVLAVPLLRRLAIVQVLASLSAGATSGLLVVLAAERLDLGPSGFGVLLAAIGIGAALGPTLFRTRIEPGDRRWLFGPFAVRGGVDLALAATTSPVVAAVGLGAYGMSTSTGMVAYQSTLQTAVPAEVRGRAFALYNVLWNAARLISPRHRSTPRRPHRHPRRLPRRRRPTTRRRRRRVRRRHQHPRHPRPNRPVATTDASPIGIAPRLLPPAVRRPPWSTPRVRLGTSHGPLHPEGGVGVIESFGGEHDGAKLCTVQGRGPGGWTLGSGTYWAGFVFQFVVDGAMGPAFYSRRESDEALVENLCEHLARSLTPVTGLRARIAASVLEGLDLSSPHLLLVTPADSYRTSDYLDAATAFGCRVTVATDGAVAIPGSAIAAPLSDPAAAANDIVRQLPTGVDAVVGTDGSAIAVAASIARILGLISNSEVALLAADNKLAQRKALASEGLCQPRFSTAADDEWCHFPAVVKPVDRSASQGVLRADNADELHRAIEVVREIAGAESEVIVEEFVTGVEVAVEGLLRDGSLEVLALFDKPETPTGPTFPETLLISPARLDGATVEAVIDLASNACAAVGLSEGPVHVECKVEDEHVWFIELAPRTIGGLCSRSLRPGGIGLEELVLRHALGLETPSAEYIGATGVLMLPVPAHGVLDRVDGVDSARDVEAVTDVIITIGPGEEVWPLPHGNRYLGFVFARASSPDAVEAALREAWSLVDAKISASWSGSTDSFQHRGRSHR